MKLKSTMNKYILISLAVILIIAVSASYFLWKSTADPTAAADTDESEATIAPTTPAADKSREDGITRINIYSVDRELDEIVKKYAEEHWEFDYKINYYSDEAVLGTEDLVELAKDRLQNGGSEIDLYCVPAAYGRDFINGEYSEYACSYKELGIDIDSALKEADIPQYVIDDGTNSDGEVVALPYRADVCVFMYRRSVAREVWGTDDPDAIADILGAGTDRWDEFLEAAQILKEHGYYIVPGFKDISYMIDTSTPASEAVSPKWKEFMDVSKNLLDNGCIKNIGFWTDPWYKDLAGSGDKIFGLTTMSNLYQYIDFGQAGSDGDWAICMPPYKIVMDYSSGILVNKNTQNKDLIGPLIEWITLDCSESGLQYRMANGSYKDGEKTSVISGTVLRNADSSLATLGGENINPILYDILKSPDGKHQVYGIESWNFNIWSDATEAYLKGEKDRETTIADYIKEAEPAH